MSERLKCKPYTGVKYLKHFLYKNVYLKYMSKIYSSIKIKQRASFLTNQLGTLVAITLLPRKGYLRTGSARWGLLHEASASSDFNACPLQTSSCLLWKHKSHPMIEFSPPAGPGQGRYSKRERGFASRF